VDSQVLVVDLGRKQLHAWADTPIEATDLPRAIRKAHKLNGQPVGPATLIPRES
jgi:hypothetical protein